MRRTLDGEGGAPVGARLQKTLMRPDGATARRIADGTRLAAVDCRDGFEQEATQKDDGAIGGAGMLLRAVARSGPLLPPPPHLACGFRECR